MTVTIDVTTERAGLVVANVTNGQEFEAVIPVPQPLLAECLQNARAQAIICGLAQTKQITEICQHTADS